jgi:ribose 5-phosphate isomerase A
MDARQLKIEAAREALRDAGAGMSLGLGTGSTSEEFVRLLAASPFAREVRCTCTSKRTEELALSLGLVCRPLAEIAPLDLAIDGADEIDRDLRLIKGRGGALLREKIVEQQALRFIVIADESKLVEKLGAGVLPVEVTPFAQEVINVRLTEMRLDPSMRMHEGKPFVTDEGNVIFDVRIPSHADIADVVARIRDHAGVVETGFFPTEATEAVIASATGVRRMTR